MINSERKLVTWLRKVQSGWMVHSDLNKADPERKAAGH